VPTVLGQGQSVFPAELVTSWIKISVGRAALGLHTLIIKRENATNVTLVVKNAMAQHLMNALVAHQVSFSKVKVAFQSAGMGLSEKQNLEPVSGVIQIV
jgi:hypothetical protein